MCQIYTLTPLWGDYRSHPIRQTYLGIEPSLSRYYDPHHTMIRGIAILITTNLVTFLAISISHGYHFCGQLVRPFQVFAAQYYYYNLSFFFEINLYPIKRARLLFCFLTNLLSRCLLFFFFFFF